MKKIAILAAVTFAATSCGLNIFGRLETGNGIPANKSYEISDYSVILSSGSTDIYYAQTPGEYSATLTTDENLIGFYEVSAEQGILTISTEKGVQVLPKVDARLTTNSSALKHVGISGSGDCNIVSNLTVDTEFDFAVSGSGDLDVPGSIVCRSFSAEITGSGDIEVGRLVAEETTIRISGSGSAEIENLSSDKISVTITGSGDITLVCQNAGDIEVKITGSGSVKLSGSARSLSQHITGSGRVNSSSFTLNR